MQRRLGLDLEVPDEFGIGLAWFTAGEGCFEAGIGQKKMTDRRWLRLRYAIQLRADDKQALEYIRATLGIGNVYMVRASDTRINAMAFYVVARNADLYHVIVPLFEKYPIPAQFRKAREFEIWKQIVEIRYRQGNPRLLRPALGQKCLGTIHFPNPTGTRSNP